MQKGNGDLFALHHPCEETTSDLTPAGSVSGASLGMTTRPNSSENEPEGSANLVDSTTYPKNIENTPKPPWKHFKNRDHSLRVSASDVAALTGFHPFRSLPKLFMDHVYQGRLGQELLRHDATLLDISIVSEDDQLLELARKAGKSTIEAFDAALKVKNGTTRLPTVETAFMLKQKVLNEAKKSNKLSQLQLKQLSEGAQHSVNTGFGKTWENVALDTYERQCGWEVYDRNGEIRAWPFVRATDPNNGQPTVTPTGRAYTIFRRDNPTGPSEQDNKRQKTHDSPKKIDLTGPNIPFVENGDGATNGDAELVDVENPAANANVMSTDLPPFFTLRGSVDGLCDELAPVDNPLSLPPSADNGASSCIGDDDWMLQHVIVECKHRMNKFKHSPPLYEQIQAVAYCFMYEADRADIVQVLRKRELQQQDESSSGDTTEKTVPRSDENSRPNVTDLTASNHLIGNARPEKGKSPSPSKPDEGTNGSGNPALSMVAPSRNLLTNYFPKVGQKASNGIPEVEGGMGEGRAGNQSRTEVREPQRCEETPHTTSRDTNKSRSPLESEKTLAKKKTKVTSTNEIGPSITPSSTFATNHDKEQDIHTHTESQTGAQLQIAVDRVFLDDPIFQHRHNWNDIILPRLRSWVNAVYTVRSCDDKRYRLLYALCDPSKIADAWRVLFEECPWLDGCDTSFVRDVSETLPL